MEGNKESLVSRDVGLGGSHLDGTDTGNHLNIVAPKYFQQPVDNLRFGEIGIACKRYSAVLAILHFRVNVLVDVFLYLHCDLKHFLSAFVNNTFDRRQRILVAYDVM